MVYDAMICNEQSERIIIHNLYVTQTYHIMKPPKPRESLATHPVFLAANSFQTPMHIFASFEPSEPFTQTTSWKFLEAFCSHFFHQILLQHVQTSPPLSNPPRRKKFSGCTIHCTRLCSPIKRLLSPSLRSTASGCSSLWIPSVMPRALDTTSALELIKDHVPAMMEAIGKMMEENRMKRYGEIWGTKSKPTFFGSSIFFELLELKPAAGCESLTCPGVNYSCRIQKHPKQEPHVTHTRRRVESRRVFT